VNTSCYRSLMYVLIHVSIFSTFCFFFFFFFFNDTATTEIYTLSLHDALPISLSSSCTFTPLRRSRNWLPPASPRMLTGPRAVTRSEEHTSELQSRGHLVCRLLLEKKKKKNRTTKKSHLSIDSTHQRCSRCLRR